MAERFNDGGPAFPHESYCRDADMNTVKPGMTLRDYFAAKSMHASLSLDPANAASSGEHARWAYEMADAMLKARGQA